MSVGVQPLMPSVNGQMVLELEEERGFWDGPGVSESNMANVWTPLELLGLRTTCGILNVQNNHIRFEYPRLMAKSV